MMATAIYGPAGEVISVVGGTPISTEVALQKLDHDAMLEQVQKRVKSQATTLSQVWDPSRGKPKPTSVTYQTLRTIARRNEWVRAIIKTRKNQIGSASWSILPQDEKEAGPEVQALCQKITNLLKRPSMHGSRPSSRSWRAFMNEVLEDVLVLDQGCIEKEWTLDKWIAALYPVDGATMAPNMDQRGGFHDDAYVQVVDGQITARFGIEDLIWIMDNPQTDVQFSGYGFSPLEGLIVSVTAELYSSKYNASYFEKGAVPEGMVNLGPEASPEDVNAFRLYWMNEIMGRPWAIPIIGGSKAEWIPWRASNKDMEYMAYQEWLLKKMLAAYQMSPKEVGIIEDVNRSTAEDASEAESEKGIQPLLTLFQDYFEVEIIGEHGLGVGEWVKFAWDEAQESEDVLDRRFSLRVEKGMATRAEWREAVGLEPGENEGLEEFFTDNEVVPLPSTPEDLEALSPARQQEKKAEEARERFAQLQGEGKAQGGNANSQAAPEFEGGEANKTAPPDPPHLREGSKSAHCEICRMYNRGLCWGYGNRRVAPDEVCDSFSPAHTGKVFDSHNPQLLESQASAEEIFEGAQRDLMQELSSILKVPLPVQKSYEVVTYDVPLAELQVDHDYQRPEDREKVQAMYRAIAKGESLPALEVNQREDGGLYITDGQHRRKALMLAGRTHHPANVRFEPSQSEQRRPRIMTAHA